MVVNTSKFQAILFGLNSNENIVLEVGECSIDVTLLGVTIDSILKLINMSSKFVRKQTAKFVPFLGFEHTLMKNNRLSSTSHL